jgi:hypothetical protein
MHRFSLSSLLICFSIVLVTVHLLVALPEEPIYLFAHNDVHSERYHSQEQEPMSAQAPRKTIERQRPVSTSSRDIGDWTPSFYNLTASPIPSSPIICLSSVILRI